MKSYDDIMRALKQPFPKGTIKKSNQRYYIPTQAYMKRLEDTAAQQWHWRVIDQPIIELEASFVMVKGELSIVGAIRQGLGTAEIKNKSVNGLKTALSTAESECFRAACDKFLMGWVDLAPYRDWGDSPAIRFEHYPPAPQDFRRNETIKEQTSTLSARKCARCQKALTEEEELALSVYKINIPYCLEHIPKQFKVKET